MPDIFLSYNREDQAVARRFADAFQAQDFDVWWDTALRSGEAYDEVTETALRTAKAVIVLWSKKSVTSRWVRAEATLADRNKTLVPVMIEPCERPIMFELTQTADLSRWQGDVTDRLWVTLTADVRRLVQRDKPQTVAAALAPRPAGVTPPQGGRPSIAVLPFTNRSEERSDDVFAGGMVEDIIAALSLGRGIKVIASSATYAYRKNMSDLKSIGHELGARYLLEGNTRRVGNTLRVTAQLLEAETGAILWTQKFDRPLSELAYLQEELVTELAGHLGVQVQRAEMERALKKPGDLTAWEALMRTWAAYARFTPEGMQIALAEARKAVALAPDFAPAQATLAMALSVLFAITGYKEKELAREAVEHAERALAIDANNATVLFQVANTMINTGRYDEALEYGERAVAQNPNMSNAHEAYGTALIFDSRFEEALAAFDEEQKLAPRGFTLYISFAKRAMVHLFAGRPEAALEAAEHSLRLSPHTSYALICKIAALEILGRREEASRALQRLRRSEPTAPLDLFLARIRGAAPFQASIPVGAAFQMVWEATPTEPRAA